MRLARRVAYPDNYRLVGQTPSHMAPKAEQCWGAILVSRHAGNAIAAAQQGIYGVMPTIAAISNVYSTCQATLSPPVGSVIASILSLILKVAVMCIPVHPMAK